MQLLSQILGGHDRPSLLVGLFLGFLFTFAVMQTLEWLQRTQDMVIDRPAAAREKVKKKKGEIQEIEQEARDVYLIGCRMGGGRVLIYALLALGLAWCIVRAWRTSIP
jgi:hypothetical protein